MRMPRANAELLGQALAAYILDTPTGIVIAAQTNGLHAGNVRAVEANMSAAMLAQICEEFGEQNIQIEPRQFGFG